jgi:hypothetical protein
MDPRHFGGPPGGPPQGPPPPGMGYGNPPQFAGAPMGYGAPPPGKLLCKAVFIIVRMYSDRRVLKKAAEIGFVGAIEHAQISKRKQ